MNSNMLSFQLTLIHLPHQTSTSIHCKPEENHTQLITLNIHFKINNNYNTTKTGEDGTGTAAAITTTGTISVLLNSCQKPLNEGKENCLVLGQIRIRYLNSSSGHSSSDKQTTSGDVAGCAELAGVLLPLNLDRFKFINVGKSGICGRTFGRFIPG